MIKTLKGKEKTKARPRLKLFTVKQAIKSQDKTSRARRQRPRLEPRLYREL